MRKKIFFSLTVCMLVITMPFMAFAHGGRTDVSRQYICFNTN